MPLVSRQLRVENRPAARVQRAESVVGGLGGPIELVARNSYDNQWLTEWPYFRIPSVMGTGLLAQRATTAGLPLLNGSVLLLVALAVTSRLVPKAVTAPIEASRPIVVTLTPRSSFMKFGMSVKPMTTSSGASRSSQSARPSCSAASPTSSRVLAEG